MEVTTIDSRTGVGEAEGVNLVSASTRILLNSFIKSCAILSGQLVLNLQIVLI